MAKAKYWETKEFKDLEREWYERLRLSGFDDAEKSINGTRILKQRASNSFRGAIALIRDSKFEYFRLMATAMACEGFSNPIHRFILERRANGFKIIEICKEL